MDDAEVALFREVADRDPPSRPVRELWVIAGRWSGKDSIASAIATVAATGDYRGHLRPGERATVMCLASDRDQAKIVQRYIAGNFRETPMLRPLLASETGDGLELRNNTEVTVSTNSFRSVRGRTVVCAILDEVSFWRDESSATPDVETYHALVPSLARVPGSVLIGITTAYRRHGLAYQQWQKHYGKDSPDVLVVKGPTPLFNPLCSQSLIDREIEEDPEKAGAEWLSEWRSDLADFIDRDLVESAVDRGVVGRPPISGVRYVAFADPSGGRGDSFTAAIAHADKDVAVLDAVYECRPPFDPASAVAEIERLLRAYKITTITGDRYAAEWVVSGFAKVRITYKHSDRDRSAIYLDALPLFSSGRVRLLDNKKLIHQFASLERRVSRMGKDRIDHPERGGADDLCNAAAGALVAVQFGPPPMRIGSKALDALDRMRIVPPGQSIFARRLGDAGGFFPR